MNITKHIQHFLISAVIVSMGIAQDFSATVTFAGENSSRGLTFGFAPDATDGYDAGNCSNPEFSSSYDDCLDSGAEWILDQYAPPAPPPPAFDAALAWDDPNDIPDAGIDRFFNQILEGDGDFSEHIYDIQLAYPSDNLIEVSWDNTGWDVLMTSVLLQDAFGGVMINVDMRAENSLTLNNPAFTGLKLKVTPGEVAPAVPPEASFSVDLPSGDAGVTVFTFTDNSTPGDAPIVLWSWFFGDDSTSAEQNPTHIYQSEGSYTVVLNVTDSNAQTGSYMLETPIAISPSPPVADAGSDTSVFEFSTITLSGAGSYDPDGEIGSLEYVWYVAGDQQVPLSSVSTYILEVPEFNPNGENTLSYRLYVTDDDNIISEDDIVVTVLNLEIAPTANAGDNDSEVEGRDYQLDGSSSFDDMEIYDGNPPYTITYLWSADPVIVFDDATLERPTITLPVVDATTDYLITLTVTDNDGLTDDDEVIITVLDIEIPPFPDANAGPDQTVDEGSLVTLDGSNSEDLDGDIVTWLWTSNELTINNAADTVATFEAPEVVSDTEYLFTLTVTDNEDFVLSDDVVVTVLNVPKNPIISFKRFCADVNAESPDTLDIFSDTLFVMDEDTMYLEVLAYDDDGEIVSFEWSSYPSSDFGGAIQLSPSDSFYTNISLDVSPALGDTIFSITSTVTDTAGMTGSADLVFLVEFVNKPPIAEAISIDVFIEGTEVALDGSGSGDPDGQDYFYHWRSLEEGIILSDTTDVGPRFIAPAVSPSDPGADSVVVYPFVLTVNDGELFSVPDTVHVSVANNAPPYIVSTSSSPGTVYQGNTVTITVSGTDSTDVSDIYGDLLYNFTAPEGITVEEGSDPHKRTFLAPAVPDTTDFQFIVTIYDGEHYSDPDSITVTVIGNQIPVADAGDDQFSVGGVEVILDASGSSDINYDELSYEWEPPAGIDLSSNYAENPRFWAPLEADTTEYIFGLTVIAGDTSLPDLVSIFVVPNGPPMADAGDDETTTRGAIVKLDGEGTDETDVTEINGELTFHWFPPDGITLSSISDKRPTFTAPDVGTEDTLEFALTVSDGEFVSDPDTVAVTVNPNEAPEADPGSDQKVAEGSVVHLDGSLSEDVNGDSLSFLWVVPQDLVNSSDEFDSTQAVTKVTLPVVGYNQSYEISLIVSDGIISSNTVSVTITGQVNLVPIADAGEDQIVGEGSEVTLDGDKVSIGGESFSQEYSYTWTSHSLLVVLNDHQIQSPKFTAPDVEAETDFILSLVVNDGVFDSEPDTVGITVRDNAPPVAIAAFSPFPDNTIKPNDSNSDPDIVYDYWEFDQGVKVQLDATGSSDTNGDSLIYHWEVWSSPNDTLYGSNGIWDWSDIDGNTLFDISIDSYEPWADIGDGTWTVGEGFEDLNGNNIWDWFDADSNDVFDTSIDTYEPWTEIGNGVWDQGEEFEDIGLEPLITDPSLAQPEFIAPDREETSYYVFLLTVTDEHGLVSEAEHIDRSVFDEKITMKVLPNKPPVAHGGDSKKVMNGGVVYLDASRSSDPNNDSFSYQWSSANTSIVFSDSSAMRTVLMVPELDSTDKDILVLLTVTDDNLVASVPDTITVTTVFNAPEPPDPPNVYVSANDRGITLTWDKVSESSVDPYTGYYDFEGYRVYRSDDGGDTWGTQDDRIYDYNGVQIGWRPIAQFDLTYEQDSLKCVYENGYGCADIRADDVSGADPLSPRMNLGINEGLEYAYIDTSFTIGVEYTYSVTAYDMGLRTYTVEYFDDDEDGIYSDSLIWVPSNPDHFTGDTTYFENWVELGIPSLESPQGSSVADPNFVKIIPKFYSSNITFPDPNDVGDFIISDPHTKGNGGVSYNIVDETLLSEAKLLFEIQADFGLKDKNNDGIYILKYMDGLKEIKEGVDLFEAVPTENPRLFIYDIEDTLSRVPIYWGESYAIDTLDYLERDSLMGLPGAHSTESQISLPNYRLEDFPIMYADDPGYKGNWTDYIDGLRFRFDNALNVAPVDRKPIIAQQYSLEDTNLIKLLDVELKYSKELAVERRPSYSYRIDFSSSSIDTAYFMYPPSCEDVHPNFLTLLPFRVTNLTTGRHVPISVADKGIDNDISKDDAGQADCYWQRNEQISFDNESITSLFGPDGRLNTPDDDEVYPDNYLFDLKINFDLDIYYGLIGQRTFKWFQNMQYKSGDYVKHEEMVWKAVSDPAQGTRPNEWIDSNEDDINENPWEMVYPWKDGDYIVIEPASWYLDGDSWTADLSKLGLAQPVSSEMLESIRVVPNPYFVHSGYEPTNPGHRIQFIHLPQVCTIKIFTVTGELVTTLNHNDKYFSTRWWNLRNGNNQSGSEVAPGLYIYVVETPAPENLKHIGKFVVVR